jgi:transcriptional regulator GlxA family with amidase domain
MIRICCLLYPGFQMLDVAGPAAVFALAAHQGVAGYSFEAAAEAPGLVRSSSGLTLEATVAANLAAFDMLFVPGGLGTREPANYGSLLAAVRKAARRRQRIVCVASGALILADAGVLVGRHTVTHWSVAGMLTERFPDLEVDGTALFTRDGNIWTSAGTLAAVDLALAIVEADYGAASADRIARALVLPFRRPGTDQQQSALLKADRPMGRFNEVMVWAREHIHEPLTLDRLADRAALSVRQFTRAFRNAVGVSPTKFVEDLRIQRARALIEGGERSLVEVACRSGFQTPDRMRRAFLRSVGRTPREIRRDRRG